MKGKSGRHIPIIVLLTADFPVANDPYILLNELYVDPVVLYKGPDHSNATSRSIIVISMSIVNVPNSIVVDDFGGMIVLDWTILVLEQGQWLSHLFKQTL